MSNIVKLNVGGTIFQTTQATLTKFDGFFRTMFETPIPVPQDESGAIFVDRSPKHFDLILNFMRDGHVDLQKYSEDVTEIQKEAEYYLLDGLMESCAKITNSSQMKLNVGGKMFITTFETLRKIPKFKDLKNMSDVETDATGSLFIDRSPKHFDIILNEARTQKWYLPENLTDVYEIKAEAVFYEMDCWRLKVCDAKIVQLGGNPYY
ncbi:hypothetical protein B9Z55_007898 [Caenorhabditis nigoni]|uniref:BTB domain-containing protein n=1 Tax=Caenorhabditis nigoni TaxID=1611254 RepID=A0A2G5VBT9_9PELO|nr:hypothetical protein B9Z55_007898 [Caenorhabditis nigoni]